MITAALDEAGIASSRYSFVPFPSDYKNIDSLLPKEAVFLMSVTGEGDAKKIAYLESLGFKAETVYSVPEGLRHERSGLVRDLGKEADAAWEDLVPKSIADYMKAHGLLDRLG